MLLQNNRLQMQQEKIIAAKEALKYVQNGMIVGLGSGSTSSLMIRMLGEKVKNGLNVIGVPSSLETAHLAKEMNIPIMDIDSVSTIDINIDGADEFTDDFQLIKGGGGALLKEKIIAHHSSHNIIIVDSGKQVKCLGRFKLPIETIPFGTYHIIKRLKGLNLKPRLRETAGDSYRTDSGNNIVDIDIWGKENLVGLEIQLLKIPGIVETGLFLNTTDLIIMGRGNKAIHFQKP